VTLQQVLPHQRVRYWDRVKLKLFPCLAVVPIGLGVLFFWAAASTYYPNAPKAVPPPVAFALGVIFVLFGAAIIAQAILPVLVVTTHTLGHPRLLRRARITPLDQITGVGLIYKRAAGDPTPEGWFLYVWTTGDAPWNVGIGYSPRWLHPASEVRQKFLAIDPPPAEQGRSVDPYAFSYHFNPVTQTDPDKLAVTRPGRVAREIYNRVLAYQGPSGYLAVRQDQKHVPIRAYETYTGSPLEHAFWSPDGELGSVPKLELQPLSPGPVPAPDRQSARPKRPGLLLRLRYGARLVGRKVPRRRA
jgi:hypothetical protein